MIKLSHYQFHPGSLWFVIPEELQQHVIPWIKSMLPNITMPQRQEYRSQLTKKAMGEKYTHSICAQSSVFHSRFTIYASYGEWRIGTGDGLRAQHAEQVKEDILASIKEFADKTVDMVAS